MEQVDPSQFDDDAMVQPRVVPTPDPPDEQFVRFAMASTVAGGVLTLVLLWWLRRNVRISWR